MRRKIVALGMSVIMTVGCLAGCGGGDNNKAGTSDTPSEGSGGSGGKVVNIYCFNDSTKDLVDEYYTPENRLPEGVTLNWIVVPSADNAYQNSLDEALLKQNEVSADEKVDMFLAEADYVLKYVNSDATLDVKKDIGLTDEQMSQMYDYTKDIATSEDGSLKGVTMQATPGLFVYRRSIAKDVLGTDDPEQVQEYLSDWDKFDEVAEKVHEKGYKMLSGFDDSYRVFSNNVTKPWVDGTKIQIDENIEKWIKQTKEYTDKGYNNKTRLWTDGWTADQGPTGNVFGFFYSTWGINFTLMNNSLETAVADGGKAEVGNGIYGDYAVCKGPQEFYWGGTWLCAANGTDNIDEVKDIMQFFCCEKEPMKQISMDQVEFYNNKEAMEEIADSDYGSDFLSGQNPYKDFCKSAENISITTSTIYDQGLTEAIQNAMTDYFNGNVDYDTALENFYKSAKEKYPELQE